MIEKCSAIEISKPNGANKLLCEQYKKGMWLVKFDEGNEHIVNPEEDGSLLLKDEFNRYRAFDGRDIYIRRDAILVARAVNCLTLVWQLDDGLKCVCFYVFESDDPQYVIGSKPFDDMTRQTGFVKSYKVADAYPYVDKEAK